MFGKMHHRIPFLLALRASVRRFQMPQKKVKLCENVSNIWNYLRNRPTSTKCDLDRLPALTHPRLYGTIFRNQYSLPHALSLKQRR